MITYWPRPLQLGLDTFIRETIYYLSRGSVNYIIIEDQSQSLNHSLHTSSTLSGGPDKLVAILKLCYDMRKIWSSPVHLVYVEFTFWFSCDNSIWPYTPIKPVSTRIPLSSLLSYLRGASSYQPTQARQANSPWVRKSDSGGSQTIFQWQGKTVLQQYPDWRHNQELHQDWPAVGGGRANPSNFLQTKPTN